MVCQQQSIIPFFSLDYQTIERNGLFMKKPNNYGSVYKLKGNRRNPWCARITVARSDDPDGTPHFKYKYLGYYPTQERAEIALARYNEHPYNTDANKVTFADVFEMWSSQHYPTVSQSNVNGYNAAYACCGSVSSMKFNDIRKAHLQHVIDTCGKNYPTLKKIRCLFSMMYKYAMDNDLCIKAYSVDIRQYSDRNPDKRDRNPFSEAERTLVWNWKDTNEYFTVILILIYSGCRISELLDLKKENVCLSERYFDIIKSKTQAGVRRVPIAKKILPFMEYWMNRNDCPYLISTPDGQHTSYRNYYDSYWMPLVDQISVKHTPHDTRHTCITMLKNAGVEERIIKKIVGHKGQGVTETVYTHYELQQLLDAIDLI